MVGMASKVSKYALQRQVCGDVSIYEGLMYFYSKIFLII